MHSRIWFEGNPWPAGHAVAEARFEACVTARGIGLLLHLTTEDYDAVPAPEPAGTDTADWDSPGVWSNYGRCTLSNTFWGIDRRTVPLLAPSAAALAATLARGVILAVDPPDTDTGEPDDHAFAIYLLGHDAVRDHRLAITPAADRLFDIDWSGRIALFYVGEEEYRHAFRAQLRDVPFAGVREEGAARP